MMRRAFLAAIICVGMGFMFGIMHPALSQFSQTNFSPVLIYVSGSLDSDHAFIKMARAGAQRAKDELEISFKEFRLPEDESPLTFIESIAEKGYSPIIAVGYQNAVPVLRLAEKFPQTQFTVIDGLVPPIYQNVQSVIFKDHEGAFLIGMLAALKSESKKIGFIGGINIPLIRNFENGYTQGARHVIPEIMVTSAMVGNTSDAWSRPDVAYDLARQQYRDGCDVIFSAAGGSSVGVLRAAKDFDEFAIGVDSNQNAAYPGHVLTSLVKRVDKAVFEAIRSGYEGSWKPGIKSLGLKEGALDFAIDQHNRELVSQDMIDRVLTARERIINGLVNVEVYSP